ncbi:MAG TPA: RNA-binding protein [Devosiaceae bacterium]|nr:RNA-binding protein [Devosiaceae bacterium]
MPRPAEQYRECALTREKKPVAELIRFVVGPDDVIVPDTDARADGRGVWISLGQAQVAAAARKNAFARSLKSQVRLPEDLPGLTRLRLEQRFIAALQMARKAGQLVTGATKVKAAIEAGEIAALITATDAAADGRDKLLVSLRGYERAAVANGTMEEGNTVPHLELLSAEQLGLALGMENVIHAALTKGAAAQAALARAERLARYLAN